MPDYMNILPINTKYFKMDKKNKIWNYTIFKLHIWNLTLSFVVKPVTLASNDVHMMSTRSWNNWEDSWK